MKPAIDGVLSPPAAVPRTRVIRTLLELERLEPEWRALTRDGSRPMQGFEWLHACARSFPTDLFVVASGGDGPARAIAPLALTAGPLRRLVLLGTDRLYEMSDFLYAEPSDLGPLTAFLVKAGYPLLLQRLPAGSPTAAALEDACRVGGVCMRRETTGSPWIALDGAASSPETLLNAGRRSDLRRARRRAAETGAMETEILAPRPEGLPALLDEAFRIEAAGWKGREGSALKLDPLLGPFFRDYAASAAASGILRLCFLRIGGRRTAMQLAVEWDSRFWLLKVGYDESYAGCSPGSLLMAETLRYAARSGLRSCEFLGETESWTRLWTRDAHALAALSVYPAKPRGLASLACDLPRHAFRGIRSALRGTAP